MKNIIFLKKENWKIIKKKLNKLISKMMKNNQKGKEFSKEKNQKINL